MGFLQKFLYTLYVSIYYWKQPILPLGVFLEIRVPHQPRGSSFLKPFKELLHFYVYEYGAGPECQM